MFTNENYMIRSRLKVVLAEHNVKRMKEGKEPLTIRDLAQELGVSPSTLTGMTTNRQRNVNYDTLNELCKYFGLPPGEFFEYVPDGRAAEVAA